MLRHGRRFAGLLLIAALACVSVALADDDDGAAGVPALARQSAHRAHSAARVVVLGHSVRGRPIRALVIGDPAAPAAALVVGCIHGNEPEGIRVVSRLRRWTPPAGMALWLVPDMNPDGRAANTRQNADGVDLNRNFSYRWRPLGPRGSLTYAGPRPLSEPESRVTHSLLLRLRPRVAIWFHQPLGVTDRSGGDVRLERRFARVSGLPLTRLPRYPGSITTWQDFRLRVGTGFVVELPPGRPSTGAITRYAHATEEVIRQVAGS